jgi:GH24 family phage-related lysozyme (muramidase)
MRAALTLDHQVRTHLLHFKQVGCKLGGIMVAERRAVSDANAQRASLSEQTGTITQGDTFGASQSSVFGNTKVSSGVNDAMQAIGKFGQQVGIAQIEKEAKADFVAGQALRAAGEELTGKERPPSRQGYKALDAKLKTQAWTIAQKQAIDNGDNDIDPLDYSTTLGDKFQELLTGDAETDAILTSSMGNLAGELGRYHAAANTKKRTADGITQATSDVRDHILAIQLAKDSGDVDGEAAARASLTSALTLPTVTSPEIRQKLASDLSVMALELGDPSVLNYVRENDIALTPQQERQVTAAKAKFNRSEATKLDKKYQDSTAEFEAQAVNAKSTEEFRELRDAYAEQWPNRATNKYLIAQEKAFRTTLAKGAGQKFFLGEYALGKIAQSKATPKQVQATIAASKEIILSDPNLDPDDAQQMIIRGWKKNGMKDDALAKELKAGMAVPLLDGELHPNYQPAYDKALEYYKVAPDLFKKHLDEQQLGTFLSVRNATTNGGMTIQDAVLSLEANRVNKREMTREEREDAPDLLTDAVDNIVDIAGWSDATNRPEIRTRVKNLAQLAMDQGTVADYESAVEWAESSIMKTHQTLGNAVIFNDGKPFWKRMGVPEEREQDVMDFMYDGLEADGLILDRDDTILLGDPKSDALLIGVKNKYGVVTHTLPASMAKVGAAFNKDVLAVEYANAQEEVAAAVQNNQDKLMLRQEAIDSGIYTAETADAALGNILGATVLEQRVQTYREGDALKEKYGIESDEELEQFKIVQTAFAPGKTLTPKQIALLEDGDTEGYLKTIGGTSGQGLVEDNPLVDASTALTGQAAISKVEAAEGKLDSTEKFILHHEGFSEQAYLDTKGIETSGVGQTGAFQGKPFKGVVDTFKARAKSAIYKLITVPQNLQDNIISAFYRGSMSGSPKTVALINKGDFSAAAKEFLNNQEYRNALKSGSGVADRMEQVAKALASMN